MAVAVGVAGFGHFFVGGGVFQELFEGFIDDFFVGADKTQGAGIDAFGALGGVAHYKDGDAAAGALFQDAAGVGQAKILYITAVMRVVLQDCTVTAVMI